MNSKNSSFVILYFDASNSVTLKDINILDNNLFQYLFKVITRNQLCHIRYPSHTMDNRNLFPNVLSFLEY